MSQYNEEGKKTAVGKEEDGRLIDVLDPRPKMDDAPFTDNADIDKSIKTLASKITLAMPG